MPKLPVGADCTLSLIEVYLRDREWSAKMNTGELPMNYENVLCLMYSTTIMRFLNLISNIGPTQEISLVRIAKKLNIPEWIVNLRHDTAHKHELPAIGILRLATNKLLSWLHDEYWKAEGLVLENQCEKGNDINLSQNLVDLVELWISVGFYIEANFNFVTELSDGDLTSTLYELFQYTSSPSGAEKFENYRLSTARSLLLTEILNCINRNKNQETIEEILINCIFESEAFLPTPELMKLFSTSTKNRKMNKNSLPINLIKFWQPFISILHDKKLLGLLIVKLVDTTNSIMENTERRLCTGLWLKAIGEGLVKMRAAQQDSQQINDIGIRGKVTPEPLGPQERLHTYKPEFENSLRFNNSANMPMVFLDDNFITHILHSANEFTGKFIKPFLDLVTPRIESTKKSRLSKLVNIRALSVNLDVQVGSSNDIIHTVDDLINIYGNKIEKIEYQQDVNIETGDTIEMADGRKRNNRFELAAMDYDWASCSFGVLPWQIDSLEILAKPETLPVVSYPVASADTVLRIFDAKNKLSGSQVKWDKVLRKNRRMKKKRQKCDAKIIKNRAMEIIKIKKG